MNHLIEQLVKDFRHHQHALDSFGRLAVEVYAAYLLEKVIEHFHEKIGCFFRIVRTRLMEGWQALNEDVIPTLQEKVKETAQFLRNKVNTLLRILQRL